MPKDRSSCNVCECIRDMFDAKPTPYELKEQIEVHPLIVGAIFTTDSPPQAPTPPLCNLLVGMGFNVDECHAVIKSHPEWSTQELGDVTQVTGSLQSVFPMRMGSCQFPTPSSAGGCRCDTRVEGGRRTSSSQPSPFFIIVT